MSSKRGDGDGIKFLRAHLSDADGPCLIWPLFRDPDSGYGRIGYLGKLLYAHRVMCELVNGEPPSDIHEACHSCGSGHEGCVHPRHLTWKTPSGNHLDRRRHGTHVTSTWGNRGKLTKSDYEEIRKLGDYLTQREIGKIFKVPFQTVSRILHSDPNKQYKIRVFQDDEIAYLREGKASGLSAREMASHLGRTFGSVNAKMYRV